MKRAAKNLVAFALVLFFASGIWCASLAAPSLSIASLTDCSQAGGSMEMAGCDHPDLCGFESSSNPLIRGTFSSTRYNDVSKNAHDVSIGEVSFDASQEAALIWKYSPHISLAHGPGKVSIRLFNSILNLRFRSPSDSPSSVCVYSVF